MAIKIQVPKNVYNIMDKLEQYGYDVYIVGGYVRDTLLNEESKDVDLFTNANKEQLLELFPSAHVLGGPDRQAKLVTIELDGIEISQYRGNGARTEPSFDLISHTKTCDFTINSIAADKNGHIIDLQKGCEDLELQEFGFVGDPKDRIEEDPLRIFRAVRFIAKLGFSFRHKGALKEYGILLCSLPKERLREEFLKIIKLDGGIELLISLGLLEYVLPKYKECIGVNGGQHHNETVDQHLLFAFQKMKQLTNNTDLLLAAFCHDIAKGECYSEDETGIHFFEHESYGANYMQKWMTEMKFPQRSIDKVVCLIRHHMWGFTDIISKRSFITHFAEFDKCGVNTYDLLMLKYCDNQGNRANKRVMFGNFLKQYKLPQKYFELKYTKEPFTIKDLCISGKDLIKLGWEPGPRMGQKLKEVFELVIDGELKNERHILLGYVKGDK